MTCHVLLHLRHLYLWSCLPCLGFPLIKSQKKTGDKTLNEPGIIASTSQGDIQRSTRETLDDPHCSQCSTKGFGFIFLSLLSEGCVVAEPKAGRHRTGSGDSGDCLHQAGDVTISLHLN